MAPLFRAPTGTRDLLSPESERARALVTRFGVVAALAGYEHVVLPAFEDARVFERLGEATEVVSKEMYVFETMGGDRLALRPEQTASLARAFVERHPVTPWKAWYAGPNFRYERPQAGRYRQFDQVGVEVLGTEDAEADIEVIALGWRFYEALGLRRVRLLVNTLGSPGDRARYTEVLRKHLEQHRDALSPASQATLERNPLRVLDSKRSEDEPVLAAAPDIIDVVDAAARAHFDQVLAGLDDLGIPFDRAPRLVRGLDYYTRTAFEYAADALDAAQNAVGGGGRYDGLVEALGGPSTPGIGFALGVDRILLACDAETTFLAPETVVGAFVVDVTGGRCATRLTDALRSAGIGADRVFDARSMKAQMKQANRSGARAAVIVGPDEVAAGVVLVRDLASGEQEAVAEGDVVERVRKVLAAPREKAER